MALLDKYLVFSNGQAITADAISDNVYSTAPGSGGAYINLGAGTPIYGVILVTTAFDSAGGTTTLTPSLLMADNAVLTTNPVTLWTGSAVAEEALIVGYTWKFVIPPLTSAPKLYVSFNYDRGDENFTAGAVKAWLSLDVDIMAECPDGRSFSTFA